MTTSVATPASPLTAEAEPHANQFALLGQRRFAPFFWTQFAGAANDNLFKFAFTVMVTYQLQLSWMPPAMAGLAIGALFILPFLLFSATSGQLTDKYDKTRVIQLVKSLEIAIMLLAAWGFWVVNVEVLLACVFLMGLHSTLFGPVKFAYLPQHLNERELTGGNGMVEMGTFVAILLGQVAGGLLVAIPEVGRHYVAVAGSGVAPREDLEAAEAVGRLLAERGAVVVCGGLSGVMEAACRGAKSRRGTTVGLLPGADRSAANGWRLTKSCATRWKRRARTSTGRSTS